MKTIIELVYFEFDSAMSMTPVSFLKMKTIFEDTKAYEL